MTHFDNEITDLKSARQLDDSRFAALRCDIRDRLDDGLAQLKGKLEEGSPATTASTRCDSPLGTSLCSQDLALRITVPPPPVSLLRGEDADGHLEIGAVETQNIEFGELQG